MANFECLYAFSSTDINLLEIQRTGLSNQAPAGEIYQWLVVHKATGNIWELDFESADKENGKELRLFIEGRLEFNESEGSLKLLGKSHQLLRRDPRVLVEEHRALLESYLGRKFPSFAAFGLRSLRPADIYHFKGWIMDPEIIRYSLTEFQQMGSYTDVEAWFYRLLTDPASEGVALTAADNGELIGYTGIARINQVDGNGEFFILIGNKSYQGRGIANQAARWVQEHAFQKLNLHRLSLSASSRNPRALRAYEKAGFIHEGRMREALYRDHEYSDKIIMGILRDG
jgi:RimJ/RimL family protein N-acetyltransferase